MTSKPPVTAVILTMNEASGIRRCIEAAQRCCDQVLVIDSHSTDGTQTIAIEAGAEVVEFTWNGAYPKKKQWGMDHPRVRNDWVLHLDADEIVTLDLAAEIATATVSPRGSAAAYDVRLAYRFDGRVLEHGHRVYKRSLVRRSLAHFPEVDDLDAPGITEVEGHYQPDVAGQIGRLNSRLLHDDPDPIGSWISRHNRYTDWEAHLRLNEAKRAEIRSHKSIQGQLFDRVPGKPIAFFAYSYIVRLGFLDGRPGFNYAFGLAWYYWLIGVKRNELKRSSTSVSNNQ